MVLPARPIWHLGPRRMTRLSGHLTYAEKGVGPGKTPGSDLAVTVAAVAAAGCEEGGAVGPRITASDRQRPGGAGPEVLRGDATVWAAALSLVAAGVVGAAQIGKGAAALPVLQDEFLLSSSGAAWFLSVV